MRRDGPRARALLACPATLTRDEIKWGNHRMAAALAADAAATDAGGRAMNAGRSSHLRTWRSCAASLAAPVYRAIERGELRASRLCWRLRVHPDDVEMAAGELRPDAVTRGNCTTSALPTTKGLRKLLPAGDEEAAG